MPTPSDLPEEFLHHIWINKLFKSDDLVTTEGDKLEVIDVGKPNSDSGPDFFNARIKIDETVWVGNVEIHKRASDWQKHNHHHDDVYQNVILHVVEIPDVDVYTKTNNTLPTMVLKYSDHLRGKYESLQYSKSWIACEQYFHQIDPIILHLGFNRLMIERLESKTKEVLTRLEMNRNDWNVTFYQFLARMFGFKINAIPFELLAKSLNLTILQKHKNNLFQLEALLFGNSGLLNKQLLGDDYFLELRDEYTHLYKKYGLKGIEGHLWKFMRLRPVNFPTIRISQFAALLHKSNSLFSQITQLEKVEDLKILFHVKASDYWDTHYNFNKATKESKPKELGDSSINTLILNVVVPFLFVYGEQQNKQILKNRALDFLDKLRPEENSTIRKWKNLGLHPRSAFETQALLQLKNNYCERKKCLNCQIGMKLVSNHNA